MAVDPTADAVLAELEAALPALRPELHRYCARMTGSAIDGEDVLQETLLKACQALQSGAEVADLRPWLFRIAHNTALNHLRARGRDRGLREAAARALPPQTEAPMPVTDSLRAFLGLTPRQRSTVILRDVLGYTAAEVAELTDSSVDSVKSALHRGRVILAESAKADAPSAGLSANDRKKLADYAACFNAHEFDRLRDVLAAEVRLELVARERLNGKAEVAGYFGNYSIRDDWLMAPGLIEGRPAILAFDRNDPGGDPAYFILLDYDGGEVRAIRDFRYARYVMADTEWEGL